MKSLDCAIQDSGHTFRLAHFLLHGANLLLDPARQKLGDSTRVSETEHETAQNALWAAMTLKWLLPPSPEVFRSLMRAVDASKGHHCIYEGAPSGIGPAYCGLSGQTAAQTLLTLA